jgi:hypothetical protein
MGQTRNPPAFNLTRWSENYLSTQAGDDRALLQRFRAIHAYLDAAIHGVEPPEVDL